MVKFNLADLTVEGLQKIAAYYGVSAQGDRAALTDRIAQRMSSGTHVVLGEAPKKWWKTPPIIVAIIAVAVAVGGTTASWLSLNWTMTNTLEQRSRAEKNDWKRKKVFIIIDDSVASHPLGITLDDIQSRYVQEAFLVEGIELEKRELLPAELKGIIMDLTSTGLVYRTYDNKYTVQRSAVMPGAERIHVENRANYVILSFLATESGKYTLSELRTKIADKVTLTDDEYHLVTNQLIALNGMIIRGGKVYSAAHAPEKKE